MTKCSCEKLIVQHLLKPVGAIGLVAQALDAVTDAPAAQSRATNTQAANAENQVKTV